jgi:TetR/AcrR family transcriptional regulator, cholesterol catabolism regulator
MNKLAESSPKRQKILATAMELFRRTHNVKRVSLEAIASEAGVSPTTIYNNFGDRETLIFEIIKDLTKQNLERNKAIVHSDLPFAQKIMSIINGKMAIAEKVNEEIISKFISQDKKIAPYINEIYEKEIKPLWLYIMNDGKEQGYIDPAIDEKALITYLDIIQAGLKAKQDLFIDFSNNLGLIEQLTRLTFYGFLKKDIDLFKKEGTQTHD